MDLNELIGLLGTMGVIYLSIIHLVYFLLNPVFINRIKYWGIYFLRFDLESSEKIEGKSKWD